MSIDVSVVIPTYNDRTALELTLAAFNCQTYPSDRYQLIIIDDGSTDGTKSLVETFETSYPIRYFWQDNAGRGKARNVGIGMAKGDILIFNDADGIPVPDFIAQHVKSHSCNDNTVVIGGKYDLLARWEEGISTRYLDKLLAVSGQFEDVQENIRLAEQGHPISFLSKADIQIDFNRVKRYVFRKSHHNWDDVYHAYSETLDGFVIPWMLLVTINVSVPKSLLMRAGPFDESFIGWGLEDTEMGYRLHQSGANFLYNEAAANYHQVHPNDIVKRWREHARNYKHFCQKHPALEVYLHWRFAAGLTSAKAYNEMVQNFYRLRDLEYKEILKDYLAQSKKLAEEFGQNDISMSSFPRPLPDSLQVSDTADDTVRTGS